MVRPCTGSDWGDQNITLKTLELLCDRFRCSISDFFED